MPKILLAIISLQMLIYFCSAFVHEVQLEANPEHSPQPVPNKNFLAAYLRKTHPFLRRQRLTKSMKSLLRSLKRKRKKRNYVFAFNSPLSTLNSLVSSKPPPNFQKSNNTEVKSSTAQLEKGKKTSAPNSKPLPYGALDDLFSENSPGDHQERRKVPRNANYHKQEPADMISLKWDKLIELLGDPPWRSTVLPHQQLIDKLEHSNDVNNDELILPSSTASAGLVLENIPAFELAPFSTKEQDASEAVKRVSSSISPMPQLSNKSPLEWLRLSTVVDPVQLNLSSIPNNPVKPSAVAAPNVFNLSLANSSKVSPNILVVYSNIPLTNLKLPPSINQQNLLGPTVISPGAPKQASDTILGNFSKASSPTHSVKIVSNGSSSSNLKLLGPLASTTSVPTNPSPLPMSIPIWTSKPSHNQIQSSAANLSNVAALLNFPFDLLQPLYAPEVDAQHALPPGKLDSSTLRSINAPHHPLSSNLKNASLQYLHNLLVPHWNRSSFAKLSNVNPVHSAGLKLPNAKSGPSAPSIVAINSPSSSNSPKSPIVVMPAQFAHPQSFPNSAMVSNNNPVPNSYNLPEFVVWPNSGNLKANSRDQWSSIAPATDVSTSSSLGPLNQLNTRTINSPLLSAGLSNPSALKPSAVNPPYIPASNLPGMLLPIASSLQQQNSISDPFAYPADFFANLQAKNDLNSLVEDAHALLSLPRSTFNSLAPNVQISSSNLSLFNSNGSPRVAEEVPLLSYLATASPLNPLIPNTVQLRALNGSKLESFPSLEASLFPNAQPSNPLYSAMVNPFNEALLTSLNLESPHANHASALNSLNSGNTNHDAQAMSYKPPEPGSSILEIPNALNSPGTSKSSESSYVGRPGSGYYESSKPDNSDAVRLSQELMQNLLLNSYKSYQVPDSLRSQANVPRYSTPSVYEIVEVSSYEETPKSNLPLHNRPAVNPFSLMDLNPYKSEPGRFDSPVMALPKSQQNSYHRFIPNSLPKSNNPSAASSPTPNLLELIGPAVRKPYDFIVPVPVQNPSKALSSNKSPFRLSNSPDLLQLNQYIPSSSNLQAASSRKLAFENSNKLTDPNLPLAPNSNEHLKMLYMPSNSALNPTGSKYKVLQPFNVLPKNAQKSSGLSNPGSSPKNALPQDSFKLSLTPLVNLAAINSYHSVTSQPNFPPPKPRGLSHGSQPSRKLPPQCLAPSFDPVTPLDLKAQDAPNPDDLVPVQSCNGQAPQPYKMPEQGPSSHSLSAVEIDELLEPKVNAQTGSTPCPPSQKPPLASPQKIDNKPGAQQNMGFQNQSPTSSQLTHALPPPPPTSSRDSQRSSDLAIPPSSNHLNQQSSFCDSGAVDKLCTTKCPNMSDITGPDATKSSGFLLLQDECENTSVTNVNTQNVIDQILENIEQLKDMQAPKDQEEMSCSVNGSWSSSAGGVVFNISVCNQKMEVSLHPKSPPCKNGFLIDYKNWCLSGMLPFPKSNRLILSGSNNKTKDVFTFIGECRCCGGTDMISGNWLLSRPSVGCNDQRASSETISDMWRKERLNELRGTRWRKLKMLKTSLKFKTTKPTCTTTCKPSCGVNFHKEDSKAAHHKKRNFPRKSLQYNPPEATTVPYSINNAGTKPSKSHMGISTESFYQKINPGVLSGKIKYGHYDKVLKKRFDQIIDGRNI